MYLVESSSTLYPSQRFGLKNLFLLPIAGPDVRSGLSIAMLAAIESHGLSLLHETSCR